ncbi:hypothetical protein [Streptosporangium sp. NBC_01756]|uniref:hypothetical protein n=1 Tax=Streptosporangium sp. NBC_01756 TaxID=2975950 RepID=UPI002DDC84EB|nr:hypothetical protein [Streptosporangium sp. NBC_01756]WSC89870.1 hypothetical protein OIE48_17305 [Streptosporangium sp. NBC_01756]
MNNGSAALRPGLIGLTVLSILGLAVELATERHWRGWEQLLPWGALILLAFGVALLIRGGSPKEVVVVRVLSAVVLLVALFGVYAHVAANYDTGFLDQRYAGVWATLPVISRLWYALTKSVGPAPPFAPGALAQAALLLLLTTLVRRPALVRRSAGRRRSSPE